MPCPLETNPSRQRMLNASRTVAPAYAQQAAQLFLGRKPAIRAALRPGQFEDRLFHFHIQGFPLFPNSSDGVTTFP